MINKRSIKIVMCQTSIVKSVVLVPFLLEKQSERNVIALILFVEARTSMLLKLGMLKV